MCWSSESLSPRFFWLPGWIRPLNGATLLSYSFWYPGTENVSEITLMWWSKPQEEKVIQTVFYHELLFSIKRAHMYADIHYKIFISLFRAAHGIFSYQCHNLPQPQFLPSLSLAGWRKTRQMWLWDSVVQDLRWPAGSAGPPPPGPACRKEALLSI